MTQEEFVNKRVQKRRDLYFYLKVIAQDGKILGRAVDITTGGMLVITEQPLEQNVTHNVTLASTNGLFGIWTKDIAVEFNVCWSKPDVNPSLFANGVKFRNMSAENVTVVQKIMRNIGFREE